MIKTKTFKENLETLYNSLERNERELNKVTKVSYYCLKDDLENKEEIQRFIELLHNGELPNDWRYDIIHSLLDSLLNNYDVNNEDEAYEHIDIISDSFNDIVSGIPACTIPTFFKLFFMKTCFEKNRGCFKRNSASNFTFLSLKRGIRVSLFFGKILLK